MSKFQAFLTGLTLVIFLNVTGSNVFAQPIQWIVGLGGNDNYYEVVQGSMSWFDARDLAASMTHMGMNGHLVTLNSQAENNFIIDNFNIENKAYWLGGYQLPNTSWGWITGESWSYTNWAPGEPNNPNKNEKAIALAQWLGDGSWNNAPDDYLYGSRGGFIVEYEPVPEPSTVILLGMGLIGIISFARRHKK